MPLTDWLILIAFGVALLAGWCSRWQWEKARDRVDDEPFDRWAKDVRFDSEYDGRGLRWDDEHP